MPAGHDERQRRAAAHIVEGRDVAWLLASRERCVGDRPFLIWAPFDAPHRTWSYKAFAEDTRRVAAGLASKGVREGDRVLIHMENCPELLFGWFACALLGAVAVLTNTHSTGTDIAFYRERTDAIGALTQPQFAAMIREAAPGLGFVAVTQTDAGAPVARETDAPGLMDFDDLLQADPWEKTRPPATFEDASIQFTSGTTSRPKAVVWTQATVLFGAQQAAAMFGIAERDVCHIALPLFHVYALNCLMGAFWSGGAVLLQRKFSVSHFWQPAIDHGATWAPLVPFCATALRSVPVPAHTFRFWNAAGPKDDMRRTFGVDATSTWGMTEIGWLPIFVDRHHPGVPKSEPGALLGRPLPGFLVSIRRADGSECAVNEPGRLFVLGMPGLTMFRSYLQDDEAFRASFDPDGWFDTGDIVYAGRSGDLFFSDRAKDIIRVGAENVSASEIEGMVMRSGWVKECAVVAAPHPNLDEVPVAFVIPETGAPADIAERLITLSRETLADHKTLHAVHVVDDFPRSTVEKIAKKVLRDRLRGRG